VQAPAAQPFAAELRANPLDSYLALHVAAIVLTVGGVAASLAVVQLNPWIQDLSLTRPDLDAAAAVLGVLSLSALATVLGIAMHIGRAVVVRQALPASRYRGPSVVVLLMLVIIAGVLASVSVVSDVLALNSGLAPSVLGSVVILTITQLAMLGVGALFVAAPRALAGLRLLPERGLWRSIGLGLLLAIPAWIGAQLLAGIVVRLLEPFGMRPEEGLAETAIRVVDPAVLMVAVVGVAPIAEEIFFRGVVYNAWLREYGARRALIGSAVLFALIHGSVFVMLPIFGLGIALALLYRATGSLPAAIAMHAGFNAITLALGLLDRYNVIQLP
jgi:uncharacterized protein